MAVSPLPNPFSIDNNRFLLTILPSKDVSVPKFILEKGTNLKFGARPLRRAIQRYVEDEISEMILRNEVHEGQNITVNFENENLKFDVN